MITISIQQPYASQIVLGLKLSEFRIWSTNVRGRVAIHASGNTDYDLPADDTTPLLLDISNNKFALTRKTEKNTIAKNCDGHDVEWDIFLRAWDYRRDNDRPLCPCRAIVGSVEIYDVVKCGEKDYEWLLRNPVALEHPLLFVKGHLGFWQYNPPPEITI